MTLSRHFVATSCSLLANDASLDVKEHGKQIGCVFHSRMWMWNVRLTLREDH